jgi:hypothetical protein
MMSGDSFERVLPIAYKSGIIDKSLISLNLDIDNYEELKVIIKNHLQQMSTNFK